MKKVGVVPVVIVAACMLVIIAFTPPIITDPLTTALNQIRMSTVKPVTTGVSSGGGEMPSQEVTPVRRNNFN